MAHRAVPPGSISRRYEAIIGGDTGELTLYLARRMLNYGAEEWKRLPWWQRQAYTNGMTWEFDRGGLFPHPETARAMQEDARALSTYTPFTSMAARAAEGITVIE